MTSKAAVTLVTEALEVPLLDNRSYRDIILGNGLEALIVHDPETDKASASLSIEAGNFCDSRELSGQAHAVEHLLFMGTEKYPKENAYNEFLSEHSGYSNAYTAATETNYYFEVDHQSLHGALDRFAQFFICPLFLPETLDRELRAVDSENKKNLQNDTWRLHQLLKNVSNPKHPFCNFSTGNLQTLKEEPAKEGINVREQFMEFHQKYYSSNRMKLVVLGQESLDQLQDWVVELFSDAKNKNLPSPMFEGEPFTKEQLGIQTYAIPVMETRSLDLIFPYMEEENHYEAQPSRYAAHLIGHEGPGSILAYLKRKGWANSLSAGPMPVDRSNALFTITIRLTEAGLENYQQVVHVIFQYIHLLRKGPPQEWIVNELRDVAAADFRFRQKTPASGFTSRMSSAMHKPTKREHLLSGSVLIRRYDEELIRKSLSYFQPDNFILQIVSKSFANICDQKEKWYGTDYKSERMPKEFIESLKKADSSELPELHLPRPNEFITTALDVQTKEVDVPSKHPSLIRDTAKSRLWHKKDDTFRVPKASTFVTIRNPLIHSSPSESVKGKLYCEIIQDALNEYAYDAQISGLDYDISAHSVGIDIELGGYNDKMPVLLEKILITMRHLKIDPDRFAIVKERLERKYRNSEYSQPYHQIGEYVRWLSAEVSWLDAERLEALRIITIEDLQDFSTQVLKRFHIEMLCHGNLYKEDALKMCDLVENILQPQELPRSQWQIRRSVIIPKGSDYLYQRALKDPKNVNSCIEYFLFIGDHTDRRLRARLLLFAQIAEEPAFDQLRTKEQLGYIVFSGPRLAATTMGYRVLIQSERPAEFLEARITDFLGNMGKKLSAMNPNEFKNHVQSLKSKRTEKLKNLTQESSRYWGHIVSEFFDFYQVEEDVKQLEKLTKRDIEDFYKDFISPASANRAKLSVHLHAGGAADTGSTNIPPADLARITSAILQYLTGKGVNITADSLQQHLQKAKLSGVDDLVSSVKQLLQRDAGLTGEKVDSLIVEATKFLGNIEIVPVVKSADPIINGTEPMTPPPDLVQPHGTKPTLIDDIMSFKSKMQISAGARPVQPLHIYEEAPSSSPKL